MPVTDQDDDDQDVGWKSYHYVKGLHRQVKQNAFYHVLTPIKHTKVPWGRVQHRRDSNGIDGEVHPDDDGVWLQRS